MKKDKKEIFNLDILVEAFEQLYDTKDSIENRIEYILSFTVNNLITSSLKEKVVYISLPFWSENQLSPNKEIGWWVDEVPLYLSKKLNKTELSNLFIYFGTIAGKNKKITNFNLSSSVCRKKMKKIPHCIVLKKGEFEHETQLISEKKINNFDYLEFFIPKDNRLLNFLNISEVEKILIRESNSIIKGSDFIIKINEISYLIKKYRFLESVENFFLNDKKFNEYYIKLKNDPLLKKLKFEAEEFARFIYLNNLINYDYLFFIPSRIVLDKDVELGAGGIIIAISNDKDDIVNWVTELKKIWLYINMQFSKLYGDDWKIKAKKDVIHESIKSAISAIMSRNMSHNIGSHVMSYVRNDLTDLKKFIEANFQTENNADQFKIWIYALNKNIEKIGNFINENKSFNLNEMIDFTKLCIPGMPPYLVGLSNFIKYLQERQDFIATITNPEVKLFMTINFGGMVLNEFQADKKPFADRFIIPVNVLLSNVARSEGYRRNDINIFFRDKDYSKLDTPSYNILKEINFCSPQGLLGRQAFYSILENIIRNTTKHSIPPQKPLAITIDTPHLKYNMASKKIEFVFQDDWLFINNNREISIAGVIYKFKENYCKYYFEYDNKEKYVQVIVRDNKKFFCLNGQEFDFEGMQINFENREYAIKEKEINIADIDITDIEKVKLIFNDAYLECIENGNKIKLITDSKNDCYNINIDNTHYQILDYDPDEYIKFTISDNISDYSKAFFPLEKGLSDDLIDESGKVKPLYKGIKEMKISATWLRGLPLHEVDLDEHFPRVFNVRCSNTKAKCPGTLKHCQNNKHGNIEYVFYLLKPKEILFILDKETKKQIRSSDIESLKKEGIDILSFDEFEKMGNPRHALNVIEEKVWLDNKNEIDTKINLRSVIIDAMHIKLIEFSNISSVLEFAWKERLNKLTLNLPGQNLSEEKIYIVDDIAKNNDTENEGFILLPSGEEKFDDYNDAKILFRKHNDMDEEFLEFKKKNPGIYTHLEFIEGISGANMTDLVIRKLPKNNLLRYRLIESCLTRIIIIDERLWDEFGGIKLSEFKKKDFQSELENFLKEIGSHSMTDWKIEMKKWLDKNDILLGEKDLDGLWLFRNSFEIIYTNYFKDKVPIINMEANIHYDKFKKKGIEILNIKNGFLHADDNIEIINLKGERVGMYKKENGFAFDLLDHYNIISIHQGIIDKILGALKIEFEVFAKKTFKDKDNDDMNWIIHSGRGLPPVFLERTFNAAFLPFSSLENALLNCKFILTELLYNVRKLSEAKSG